MIQRIDERLAAEGHSALGQKRLLISLVGLLITTFNKYMSQAGHESSGGIKRSNSALRCAAVSQRELRHCMHLALLGLYNIRDVYSDSDFGCFLAGN